MSDEYQYLNLIENILKFGSERTDRTGIGTKSIFGACSRYSLRNSLMILFLLLFLLFFYILILYSLSCFFV